MSGMSLKQVRTLPADERNFLALAVHEMGLSFDVVGTIFGVSRQRAHQYVVEGRKILGNLS